MIFIWILLGFYEWKYKKWLNFFVLWIYMEETINEIYINQQKLINKLSNNKEIIKTLNNDIQ